MREHVVEIWETEKSLVECSVSQSELDEGFL